MTTVQPDDDRLVAMAQAGDRAAVEQLLRHHLPQISALCRRLAGNPVDGDDATQEALIAIVKGLARFDGRSRFSTWVYRVATNACLDELRRRRRRPEPIDQSSVMAAGVGNLADEVADAIDVSAALGRLAPEFRAAVVLRDLCHLDYAEIAEVLDVPVGTVRSRIARGRAALVPLLGPSGPLSGPGGPSGELGNQPQRADRPNPGSP